MAFGQDKDYKYKIKRTAGNSRGYFDDELTKQTRDWKEAIDIGAQDGDLDGRSDIDGFNQWPHEDAHFRASVETYFKQMEGLSKTLCTALALGLGERANFFDPLFEKHTSYLRINHYPPCPNPVANDFPLRSPNTETEGYLAINRHTDAGVLTVLRQKHDEPHSLQVFISDDVDKDHESRSGQWVCVRSAALICPWRKQKGGASTAPSSKPAVMRACVASAAAHRLHVRAHTHTRGAARWQGR